MGKSWWQPCSFDDLPNWKGNGGDSFNNGFCAAFSAFLKSAEAVDAGAAFHTKALGVSESHLRPILKAALAQAHIITENLACRSFFEQYFMPFAIEEIPPFDQDFRGLLTGYYEPQVAGSRIKTRDFSVPLLRRPDDLLELARDLAPDEIPADWPEGLRFGRKAEQGLVPYYDRAAIEADWQRAGMLAGRGLELVWLSNWVDAFFIHIQGSAAIALDDGSTMRVSYDGKSGHDYTAIGTVLKHMSALPRTQDRGKITMDSIRAWLAEHPTEQRKVLQQNQSFIFFKEDKGLDPALGPKGAAGVQLTPGRSLAVDRMLHTFHTPIYMYSGDFETFDDRLMIAQDTGSAIVGVERGDFFAGSGAEAGQMAGELQLGCGFAVLVPKPQDTELSLPEGYKK